MTASSADTSTAGAGKALALISELESAGGLSTIGLHLADPNLPYEQYAALCVMLGKMHEAVRFAIGDAIILGEQLYKERAYQAIEMMNVSENARLEYVRVSSNVPRSTRRKDLSWSHHRAVAALPPAEQKIWLRRASDEHMSHATLREELRNGADPAPAQRKTCECCGKPL
jgi:hypothetical protein